MINVAAVVYYQLDILAQRDVRNEGKGFRLALAFAGHAHMFHVRLS